MRKLHIDWMEFSSGCDCGTNEVAGEVANYLDLETGKTISVFSETDRSLDELLEEVDSDVSADQLLADAPCSAWEKQALQDAWRVRNEFGDRIVRLPEAEARDNLADMRDFADTVRDPKLRTEFEHALTGRSPFRRFRDVIHDTFRERQQWFRFKEERLRGRMTRWLASLDIEVEWVLPAPPPPEPSVREHLLEGVLKFVRMASGLGGVKRIALLGSLTTNEPEPKDADVLVAVHDAMDLTPLAAAARKLGGRAQQRNRGADVFLANERDEYIGRVCEWRECAPGIRARCDALHCGRRPYLHDDLRAVRLEAKLVAEPPIDLWPVMHARVQPPSDVEAILLAALRDDAAKSSGKPIS